MTTNTLTYTIHLRKISNADAFMLTAVQHMELDIFYPSYALAFEYQGKQHYEDTFLASCRAIQERDREKLRACQLYGITLIQIPYTQDLTPDYLRSTIQHVRPDLILHTPHTV